MRRLAALVAVLVLAACTPEEQAQWDAFASWYSGTVEHAVVTGQRCAELAGDVAYRQLPPHFLEVIWRESRCDPQAVNSESGALGLTQILPEWIPALCLHEIACTPDALLVIDTNLDAAVYVFAVQGPDAWSQTW